jgi:putative acetyltransferase
MMNIRTEKPDDIKKIRSINLDVFNTDSEANLIDALRKSSAPLISLVAEENNVIVGHILFSPVTLEGDKDSVSIAGLAPMAVLSSRQNQGIGSGLVEAGLRLCKQAGYKAVAALGHPGFYSRFGFMPSEHYNIRSEYDVPADVFMIKELHDSALDGQAGIIKYNPAFNIL